MRRVKAIDGWWFGALVAALIIAHPGHAAAKGIGGTLTLNPVGSATKGACSDSYDDVCPSGDCECQEYTGKFSAHFGGLSGRGTADVSVTLDNGLQTAQPHGCRPVFGNAFLSTPLGSATINLTGAFCDAFGNSAQMKLLGGFGIAPGGAVGVGFGTLSGATNPKKNTLVVHFKGVSN